MKTSTMYFLTGMLAVISQPLQAASLSVPNSFSAGSPAVAAEVNSNFGAVKGAVDDNDARIKALETTLTALQTTVSVQAATLVSQQNDITTANNTITTLQTTVSVQAATLISQQNALTKANNNITALEGNSVLALDGNLIYSVDANGYPTAQFTGVNVQVVNGVGQTSLNGLGNLIVGYNDARILTLFTCSDGQYSSRTSCQSASERWAVNHKTGSHNLVAGNKNSYSQYGGVVFGENNAINGFYSVVKGGDGNIASAEYSSISGGHLNNVRGYTSSISGGTENYIDNGSYAGSISGGASNYINSSYSSVSGGRNRGRGIGIYSWAAGSLTETN